MRRPNKVWVGALLLASLAALVALGAGLSGLDLGPGEQFTLRQDAPIQPPPAVQNALENNLRLWVVLSIVLGVLLPVAVIYILVNPELRKRVLRDAIGLAAVAVAFYFLLQRNRGFIDELLESLQIDQAAPDMNALPVVEPGSLITQPPAWLSFVATALILLVLGGLGIWLWRKLAHGPDMTDLIAREALHAAEALRSGASFKETVMQCYYDMGRILSEQRGIERDAAMTPREFVQYLRYTSLPAEHIERLTRLFEAVRYGSHTPGEAERQEAVQCLSAIADLTVRHP